ncbi:hypothetical protein [Natronobeatus ordinarius]|uniref:hypothetical protein n=1 Tax=Natronobeatus ordinarius TaxID=2963433 RepID=UPI0020CC8696|nr:hypothetical protein [Natronobeatus ordinarius]
MVSDPDSDLDRSAEPDRTDGGYDVGLDEQELYLVVRTAVKDAMLDVVGTLVLLGFALGLVWIGGWMAIDGDSTGFVAAGGAFVVAGALLAAVALELLPPIRDWF